MTHPAVARPRGLAPAAAPSAAAELASRIRVPRRLPLRYDGEPMRHLSHSSYSRFLLCPEDWRRHYLKGERSPASGSMFLGGRVDDALTLYYRYILEHGDALSLDQVKDAYRDLWRDQLVAEQDGRGLDWDDQLPQPAAFTMGLEALELTFATLVPRLGAPVAVQRRLEFVIAPGLEWTVQCHLDLETERADDADVVAPAVVDYKVKGTLHSQTRADADPQAALYLAARWLAGDPARDFSFAQIGKPGKRRKQMTAKLVTTRRTIGELRGSLVRIAQAARQIHVLNERFGPDEPWGFADPTSWKCAPAYCRYYARGCPGGAGL
jgi:hypothetical protein